MGVSSSAAFFETPGLIHLTFALVHPIFVNDKGLSAINLIGKSTLLQKNLKSGFTQEAAMLSEAFIVLLGETTTACCEWLV